MLIKALLVNSNKVSLRFKDDIIMILRKLNSGAVALLTLLPSWYSLDCSPEVTLAPVSCQLFTITPSSLVCDQTSLGASCCLMMSADTLITVVGWGTPMYEAQVFGGTYLERAVPVYVGFLRYLFIICMVTADRDSADPGNYTYTLQPSRVWYRGWQHDGGAFSWLLCFTFVDLYV